MADPNTPEQNEGTPLVQKDNEAVSSSNTQGVPMGEPTALTPEPAPKVETGSNLLGRIFPFLNKKQS